MIRARKVLFTLYAGVRGSGLRETIADYYKKRKVSLLPEEVFVSSGASDELGDILDLFGRDKTVMIMEPAYPAYVDAI